MNPALRLADIITALERVGLTVLVKGGNAVRYYGIDRNTLTLRQATPLIAAIQAWLASWRDCTCRCHAVS